MRVPARKAETGRPASSCSSAKNLRSADQAPLRLWIIGWAVILVIASVWTYGLLEFLAYRIFKLPEVWHPWLSLFTVPLMGGAAAGFSKRCTALARRRILGLAPGIKGYRKTVHPHVPLTSAQRAAFAWVRVHLKVFARTLVLVAFCTFAATDFTSFYVFPLGGHYEPIFMLGMIFPVSVALWFQSRGLLSAAGRLWLRFPPAPGSERQPKIPDGATALRRQLVLTTAVIVVASVMVYSLIEFVAYVLIAVDQTYNPLLSVGMIFPMALIVGAAAYLMARGINRRAGELMTGISRVSRGEFSVRLEAETAGAFSEVFAQFNRMGEELSKVQTLRDDFINGFSHEFRTPISSINGFANLLLDDAENPLDSETRQAYLGIIAAESARLAELSNATLLLTQLEATGILSDRTGFALDEQLRQCVILLAPQWEAKKLEMELELDELEIRGNPDLTKQMWINLLGNAVKYTPKSGMVRVTLAREGEWAQVTIRDTGPGMSEDELGRLFEKYWRGEAGKGTRGLGLGLAIVKRITDLSGGSVHAESAPGTGSSFIVKLPLG